MLAALLLGSAVATFAATWRPAIAAVEPPMPQEFDAALVSRGRELAAIGNCNNCHTMRAGKNFAGGLPVPTPFGTIYSSNITPDPETGIGRWSEAAFQRAMRLGVDREGRHLYPTFPYDHFTHVSEDDDRALYAYLMTRAPVHAPARENQLSFPLNQRVVVAGWSCCSCVAAPISPTTRKARNGIAAPILWRDLRIAAHATRRAMHWVPRRRLRLSRAAMSTIGRRMRSTPNRLHPCRGTRMRCMPICATASILIMAPRVARWRTW